MTRETGAPAWNPDPALVTAGWAKWHAEGTTTLEGSENVSSLTDNAAGDFTITWARAFASASSYSAHQAHSAVTAAGAQSSTRNFEAMTSTTVRTDCRDYAAQTENDPDEMHVFAIGEY